MRTYYADIDCLGGNDDCNAYFYDSSWSFKTNLNDIKVGYHSGVSKNGSGLRFQGINIQRDAQITSAYLRLSSNLASYQQAQTVNSRISGELNNNASQFSTLEDYQSREKAASVIDWDDIPIWNLQEEYQSPDISSIIQEIVGEFNGLKEANIVLFWDDHDDRSDHDLGCHRSAFFYEQSDIECPKLHIEWESDLPLYGLFSQSHFSDFKYEINEKEIFNDIRALIPRYSWDYDYSQTPPVFTPIDYLNIQLNDDSIRKYGRRTRYVKWHTLHHVWGESLCQQGIERYREPYPCIQIQIIGSNKANIKKILRAKITDKRSVILDDIGLNDEFHIEELEINVKQDKVLNMRCNLVQMRPFEAYQIFKVDEDLIDSDRRIG